jgi:hypothetical protein
MAKKGKKSKPVVNKKKEKDIVVKIDRFTGRIPTAKAGEVIHGKKYNKKAERSKVKQDLKKYM